MKTSAQAAHRGPVPLLTLPQKSPMAAAVVHPPASTASQSSAGAAAESARAQAHLPILATDASDISTATRARSTSSCNSAPLSTLPSSTSPAPASKPSSRFLSTALPASPQTASSRYNRPRSLQPVLGHQPGTDSSSPPVSPAGIAATFGRTGRYCFDGTAHRAERLTSNEQKRIAAITASRRYSNTNSYISSRPVPHDVQYNLPYLLDDVQADDAAKSVNSQDLAWDQTRLRISYLVSSMATPDGGYSPRGSLGARPSPAASSADADSRPDLGVFPAASRGPSNPSNPHHDYALARCLHGWPGLETTKKRRRIAQINRWADEIAALDDAGQTFCGCSSGSPIPPYDLPDSDGSAAVSPPSQPEEATSPATPARCDYCTHFLTPIRPYVHVDDAGMPKSHDGASRTLRRAYKSIRDLVTRVKTDDGKAASAETNNNSNSNTAAPLSPKQQQAFNRKLCRMRPWDQWHELNCNQTAGDFFTQTTMFHGNGAPLPETNAHAPPPPWYNTGLYDATAVTSSSLDQQPSPQRQVKRTATAAATTAAAADADAASSSFSSIEDSEKDNSEERQRRRQWHLDARIRRAQRLLEATHV